MGGLIADEDGRILLVQHVDGLHEFWADKWMLPGGYLKFGENLEDGVKREILEETNLVTEIVEPLPPLDRILSLNGKVTLHVVYVDYRLRIVGGDLKPGSDVARVQWFDAEDIRDNWQDIHLDTQWLFENIGWGDSPH